MNRTATRNEGRELALDRQSPRKLNDAALLEVLKADVAFSNRVTARLLLDLGEVDHRHLYLADGCSSMFGYCVEVLHLSESAAYKRIHAARAARRFPIILDRVAQGELHLSGVRLLAPHLTDDNHRALLDEARHATKRQIERLVAERFELRQVAPATTLRRLPFVPRDDATESRQRGLPGARAASAIPPLKRAYGPQDTCGAPAGRDVAPVSATKGEPDGGAPGADGPAPRNERVWRLHASLRASTHEKLQRAQALLRHQIPDGDVDAILDRALATLIDDIMTKRFAVGRGERKGRASKQSPESRHIPHDVRRAVIARDGARCTFVSVAGRRCAETGFLELDHLKPWALGGESTTQNLAVRCRAHNLHAAERVFGARFMARRRPGKVTSIRTARKQS